MVYISAKIYYNLITREIEHITSEFQYDETNIYNKNAAPSNEIEDRYSDTSIYGVKELEYGQLSQVINKTKIYTGGKVNEDGTFSINYLSDDEIHEIHTLADTAEAHNEAEILLNETNNQIMMDNMKQENVDLNKENADLLLELVKAQINSN